MFANYIAQYYNDPARIIQAIETEERMRKQAGAYGTAKH